MKTMGLYDFQTMSEPELRKVLHKIVDELTEEDLRLFFKIGNYNEFLGVNYLSLRYRFRQVLDFASWYIIQKFEPEFEPNTRVRLVWKNFCELCGGQNIKTNAKICPDCEKKLREANTW